jgi:exonuclease VII large subunit
MKKGFAVVSQEGIIKKSIKEIEKDKQLDILISGGEVSAKILAMKGNKDE